MIATDELSALRSALDALRQQIRNQPHWLFHGVAVIDRDEVLAAVERALLTALPLPQQEATNDENKEA